MCVFVCVCYTVNWIMLGLTEFLDDVFTPGDVGHHQMNVHVTVLLALLQSLPYAGHTTRIKNVTQRQIKREKESN